MPVDMFMQIDTVKGESADANFAGAIEVLSWNWGMTQSGSTHTATGSGLGKVNVGDISFVKAVDSTSPTLAQSCCNGVPFDKATLSLRKAGGSSALVYLVITLQNVIVSSVQLASSSTDEAQMETISLNFGEFTYEYTAQAAAGTGGATTSITWNIPGNSPTLT